MTKRTSKRDKEFAPYVAGVKEGRRQTMVAVLSYLENRYMDRSHVRGSAIGKAILQVAADVAQFLREFEPEAVKTDGEPVTHGN